MTSQMLRVLIGTNGRQYWRALYMRLVAMQPSPSFRIAPSLQGIWGDSFKHSNGGDIVVPAMNAQEWKTFPFSHHCLAPRGYVWLMERFQIQFYETYILQCTRKCLVCWTTSNQVHWVPAWDVRLCCCLLDQMYTIEMAKESLMLDHDDLKLAQVWDCSNVAPDGGDGQSWLFYFKPQCQRIAMKKYERLSEYLDSSIVEEAHLVFGTDSRIPLVPEVNSDLTETECDDCDINRQMISMSQQQLPAYTVLKSSMRFFSDMYLDLSSKMLWMKSSTFITHLSKIEIQNFVRNRGMTERHLTEKLQRHIAALQRTTRIEFVWQSVVSSCKYQALFECADERHRFSASLFMNCALWSVVSRSSNALWRYLDDPSMVGWTDLIDDLLGRIARIHEQQIPTSACIVFHDHFGSVVTKSQT
ncbi:uncharacterized protein BJ171DRAFT_582756 [Polychytrium aggregatum]|uniref:uncharacterized protein n=1 Tax=Polychytrium aggregatum TaxID=110093 RepID=UPI0022FDDAB5|nr:uncharacterized protein BJ171DRAFT_582756 [Polychytrium aggregatum]KAI9203615.1 hypothetical protein BJ171DRAFT_582756 [Polychytrium aggregatum]